VSNVVDFNPQRGSVVLRGIEIDLETDIGRGFVADCARFTEGLLPEDQIKSKYGLSDNAWARLADNEPLVRAVETEKARRVRDGTAAREVQAPTVLGDILNDTTVSPRHRVEAARELRQRTPCCLQNAMYDSLRCSLATLVPRLSGGDVTRGEALVLVRGRAAAGGARHWPWGAPGRNDCSAPQAKRREIKWTCRSTSAACSSRSTTSR
jgi:hypothetical protein